MTMTMAVQSCVQQRLGKVVDVRKLHLQRRFIGMYCFPIAHGLEDWSHLRDVLCHHFLEDFTTAKEQTANVGDLVLRRRVDDDMAVHSKTELKRRDDETVRHCEVMSF
jgi:hypothetical protein